MFDDFPPGQRGLLTFHSLMSLPDAPAARTASKASAERFDRLDALRGVALVWMAIFHFCFDLSNYRLIQTDFYHAPVWTTQRTIILSMFLVCAGAGQAIATAQGQTWARFWRRWAQILGCALLVTAGSARMFPHSYIYFGVLHGMCVMLILARLSARLGWWLWLMGAVVVALPRLVADPFFDTRWTNWVGLVTHKPITEDYVPILPWLGVMFWGMAATQWVLAHHPKWLAWAEHTPATVSGSGDNTDFSAPDERLRQGLATLGRWSLTFYMVHQPLLIGALMAGMTLAGYPFH
jgi:uncharacterized membrane protein